MRERAFIESNKKEWQDFDNQLKTFNLKAEHLIKIYHKLTNDLSYAQTFYPKSDTTLYLNTLSAEAHMQLYKTKKQDKKSILELWKTEVPLLMYEYRKLFYFTFFLFICFICVGIVSSKYDQSFVRLILGDSYVNQSLKNIEAGDPLAVYSGGSHWGSAIAITINNLKVGILSYVGGIFAGIGTFYILFQNSVMIGAFQYFFYEHDVFIESVSGIWLHGSMEIFAIVVEAFAGFLLGTGFLFPKTLKRLQSLKIKLRQSLKIVISTFPFTILAGIIEGFITRYYNEMPMWFAFTIIGITLFTISYYYLIYPFKINKQHQNATTQKA